MQIKKNPESNLRTYLFFLQRFKCATNNISDVYRVTATGIWMTCVIFSIKMSLYQRMGGDYRIVGNEVLNKILAQTAVNSVNMFGVLS